MSEQHTFWGWDVLCGGVAETSAPEKAEPGMSQHVQETSFMASRKITRYLFPPYDKYFRDTYSSPVAYTNIWLRQCHNQARAPCSSTFLLTAFLSWYSEVSTVSSKVHPPGTVSKEFNQWCVRSISSEEIQKCSFFTHMPKRSSFVSHKKFSACSSKHSVYPMTQAIEKNSWLHHI